jgi:uncharacterized protein YndB with AHSA1/START domain
MSARLSSPHLRKIEQQIELEAPVEVVWRALTEGNDLACWYPLEARVTPGRGGSVTISFGAGMEATERIEIWEPGKHLRTYAGPPGAPVPDSLPEFEKWLASNPDSMGPSILDFYLEARGGKTLLRLVHSGFLSGAAWEDEYYDALDKGWPFMLYGLRHYVRHHLGTPRIVAWPTRNVGVSPEVAWSRIMSPSGLLAEGSPASLRPGERYSIRAVTGDRFAGVVEAFQPGRFRATVENMNNAFFAVMIEKCGGPTAAGLWLSTFGVPQAEADAFRDRWMRVLESLFPEPPEEMSGPLAAPAGSQ